MEDSSDKRISWLVRINVRENARDGLRLISHQDRIPMSTLIGMAIEQYVTVSSTS